MIEQEHNDRRYRTLHGQRQRVMMVRKSHVKIMLKSGDHNLEKGDKDREKRQAGFIFCN